MIQRSTRKVLRVNTFPDLHRDTFLLDLAPSGVCLVPNVIIHFRDSAHHGTPGITTGAVGSYPAFSPLSRSERRSVRESIFSVALSVSRINRDPGRYPALLFLGVRTFLSPDPECFREGQQKSEAKRS